MLIIPKQIYEIQPYLYLVIGALSVLGMDEGYAKIAGLILYCLGSLIWVMRSNYRRKDRRRSPRGLSRVMPELLYEFMPFLYIAAAMLLFSLSQILPSIIFSSLLFIQGVYTLYQRKKYRKYLWHGLRPH